MINNIISNYVFPTITSSTAATIGTVVCAIPAAELAGCGTRDLIDFARPPADPLKGRDSKLLNDAIYNLGASMILGGCALNLVPGAAFLGALGFLYYAKKTWIKGSEISTNKSIVTFYTGMTLFLLSQFKREIATNCMRAVSKSVKTVASFAKGLFQAIAHFVQAASQVIKVKVKLLGQLLAVPLKIAKSISKFATKLLQVPAKLVGGVVKMFNRAVTVLSKIVGKLLSLIGKIAAVAAHFIARHPIIALAIICAVVILIPSGAPALVASLFKGIFSAGVSVIGAVPSVLAHSASIIATVAKGIFMLGGKALGAVPTIVSGGITVLGYTVKATYVVATGIISAARFVLRI